MVRSRRFERIAKTWASCKLSQNDTALAAGGKLSQSTGESSSGMADASMKSLPLVRIRRTPRQGVPSRPPPIQAVWDRVVLDKRFLSIPVGFWRFPQDDRIIWIR